jgi:hypothetical protein
MHRRPGRLPGGKRASARQRSQMRVGELVSVEELVSVLFLDGLLAHGVVHPW